MMKKLEPLNTLPLQQFIQQVKSAESSRSKEIKMDIDQAKNLALTLGIVMSRLTGDLEKFITELYHAQDQTIEIKMDGGHSF